MTIDASSSKCVLLFECVSGVTKIVVREMLIIIVNITVYTHKL